MAKYVDDSHRPHLLLNGKVNGRLASKQNAVELIKPRPILFILNMIRIFVVVVIFIQSLFSLQYNGDSGNEANLKQHFGTTTEVSLLKCVTGAGIKKYSPFSFRFSPNRSSRLQLLPPIAEVTSFPNTRSHLKTAIR